MAENLVYLELMKKEKEYSLGYWRGSNEIDTIPDREFKGFKEFVSDHGVPKNGMKILTRDLEGKEEDVDLIPLWKWLLK